MDEDSKKDRKLVLVPFYYLIAWSSFVQCVRTSHSISIGFDFCFLCFAMVFLWQGSLKNTFGYAFGVSKFNIRDRRCCLTMTGFILSSILLAGLCRLDVKPDLMLNWHQKTDLFVLGPLVEEAIGRCLIMNALLKFLPETGVLFTTIAFWLCIHALRASDPLALIACGTLAAGCYLRFSSLGCCFILHSIWNVVIELGA